MTAWHKLNGSIMQWTPTMETQYAVIKWQHQDVLTYTAYLITDTGAEFVGSGDTFGEARKLAEAHDTNHTFN